MSSAPKEKQNLNLLIRRKVFIILQSRNDFLVDQNNGQSALSSMRFEFESGHSINGTSNLFSRICKLSIIFLSSFALLNMKNTFTAKCANFAM